MIKRGGPESLAPDLVRELVDRDAKLLEPSPGFIERSFATMLCFIPSGHSDGVDKEVWMWFSRTVESSYDADERIGGY
jgi:hypothetical protein